MTKYAPLRAPWCEAIQYNHHNKENWITASAMLPREGEVWCAVIAKQRSRRSNSAAMVTKPLDRHGLRPRDDVYGMSSLRNPTG